MKRNLLRQAIVGTIGAASLLNVPFATAEEESAEVVEEVMVTGSRIQRDTFSSSAPVTVIDAAAINASGTTNLGEYLKQIPQAFNEGNPSDNNFSNTTAGVNTTSLRSLGQERTLVLVNGRRYVSGYSPGSGYAVDLNSIPTSIIERIEILTGGQSAVYGSDAIAGVVNVITRKNIEGAEVSVRKGISEQGDAGTTDIDLAFGSTFDRGNAYATFGYSKEDGLQASDRDFSEQDIAAADTTGDGFADSWEFLGSSFPPGGRFSTEDDDFNGDGTAFTSADRFNRGSYRALTQPIERKTVSAGLNIDLNDSVRSYSEFNLAIVENESNIEPTPLDINGDIYQIDLAGVTSGLDINSPLIPDDLRNAILASDPTVTTLADLGVNNTPRRLVEFGPRGSIVDRTTLRGVTGLDILLDNGWSLDAHLNYGKTTQTQLDKGGINTERALQALDVEVGPDGELRCVSDIARAKGCVPFTPFGEGTITAEQVEYLSAPGNLYSEVEQQIASTTLSGELPFELGAGLPVSFAVGAEYRIEKGSEYVGAFDQTGVGSSNRILPTDGEFSVMDYYGELLIPVIPGTNVELAARVGDYSTVGTISTFKFGIDSELPADLRARATYSSAVRAPNVSDLFAGQGETFATITDPCDGLGGTDAPTDPNVVANCQSNQAIADRVADEGSFTLTQVEKQSPGGFFGGNPDVAEESSTSFTAGLVWTPMNVEGLNVAVDYFSIEVDEAISITTRTEQLKRCYNADPSEFSADCGGLMTRDADTGAILSMDTVTSNENILRVEGVDIEASYAMDLGPGTFGTSVVWNHLLKQELESIKTGDVDDNLGEVDSPENKAVFNFNYVMGPLRLDWNTSFWGEVKDSNQPGIENTAFLGGDMENLNKLDAMIYHDVRAAYDWKTYNFFFGITNLTDEKPPILGQGTQFGSVGINTAPQAYDVVGRAYYAGFKATF